jgi:hypothetical protein
LQAGEAYAGLHQRLSTAVKQALKKARGRVKSFEQQLQAADEVAAVQKQADIIVANIYRCELMWWQAAVARSKVLAKFLSLKSCTHAGSEMKQPNCTSICLQLHQLMLTRSCISIASQAETKCNSARNCGPFTPASSCCTTRGCMHTNLLDFLALPFLQVGAKCNSA